MLLSIFVYGYAQTYHTLQVGGQVEAAVGYMGYLNPHCGFEQTVVNKANVYGLSRGTAYSLDRSDKLHVYKVVQVVDVKIPNSLNLSIGDSYTYTPIITDEEAYHTLTWTSSNPSVATVNSNGEVTTLATGQTVITCTAQSYTYRSCSGKPTNSVSSVCVITVSPILIGSVDIEESQYNIEVGQQGNLNCAILPENASNKTIKWLSSNDNIVQVNDEGVITGISPGYCSVYAIANDDSRKFDKVLVHVEGKLADRADVNGDGNVSIADAVAVVNVILNNH